MLHGTNNFPNNWNDFIDLLIMEENLYKKRKNRDKERFDAQANE